jgi:glycosyltransferase involved in cell wall biosynthesis
LGLVRRIPYFLEVRDLWPAVAVSLGELTGSRSIKIAQAIEKFLYNKAAGIVTVTKGFSAYIQQRGIRADKITWIPNGTTPEIFNPALGDRGLRGRLNLEGKFVVTYAGLHGIAQGLQTILDAAAALRDQSEITFMFIGEGPEKENLIRQKEKESLDNVLFFPQVPRDSIVYYINMSDILLVPLKKDPIFESFIPSKLYDFMACAKPILLSVPGEAKEIMEQAGAGIFIPPEDPILLRETIQDLYQDRTKLEQYRKKGREVVIQHYSRASQARQLADYLQDKIKSPLPD